MERDTESESDAVGHVTFRSRLTSAGSSNCEQSPLPSSRSYRNDHDYSYAPIHSGDTRSPSIKKSSSHQSVPDLLPPEMGATPKEPAQGNSFKSWLTSGILDVLGAAAGVTLSTTGKLVAPPLHVTKTLLLPGLLAIFVDTLDAITPFWVQDWFRIISSSLHHLMVVLGNTEKGQLFSNQVYVVLQDMLQVFSSTETRQVLVDAMATSVRFAGALNTQEMKEFLDQLSTLGVRVLDAASSGKSKQFLEDTKMVAWKGIEMAADPATTLALAEVTAHLCHALEDAQSKLNPPTRKRRDEPNRSIYLNPYQMENFPEQVSMEEVILSCLGRVEEAVRDRIGDDAASIQSRLTLDDELSLHEPEYRDWKDRKEQVNVRLLRDKILEGHGESSMTRSDKASVKSTVNQHVDAPEKTPRKVGLGKSTQLNDIDVAVLPKENERPHEDVEDIDPPGIPGARRLGLSVQEMSSRVSPDDPIPSVQLFYEKLDDMLRHQREIARGRHEKDSTHRPNKSWKGRIKKMNDAQAAPSGRVDSQRIGFPGFTQKYKSFIVVALLVGTTVSSLVSGLACYGLYTLVWGGGVYHRTGHGIYSNQEVVFRVVREVVHVNEHGKVLGKSEAQVLTQKELDDMGQKVAAFVR